MARETKPKIHIDDLHLVTDGFVHAYKATWQESGLIATLYLDIVEREHWRPGHYRQHAYELIGATNTVNHHPMGPVQEETASLMLRELRSQMLDAMVTAGWQSVDTTREGQDIYQYRPAPHLPGVSVPEAEILPIAPTIAAQDVLSEQKTGIVSDELPGGQGLQHETKVYKVYGSKEAREKGADPAYTRTVAAKTVTFNCAICGNKTTHQCYPGGRAPRYCDRVECHREATRLRVERSREKKQKTIL